MSVKLVFGDSLAAIKLFDAAADFRVDAIAIFQKPAILLFLSLEQAQQYFLNAARTSRLELPLKPGFQSRIANNNRHGSIP
jgi:hypothetical protein